MSKFIDSANSRETDPAIMEAILYVADGDEADAVRIWEEPNREELLAIWERVTRNGLHDATDFYWGSAGSDWWPNDDA